MTTRQAAHVSAAKPERSLIAPGWMILLNVLQELGQARLVILSVDTLMQIN